MAKPELGTKRLCLSCGAKFYDLNRDPILCPKCSAPFYVAAVRAAPLVSSTDDEDEAAEGDVVDIVSLDDVAAEESAPEIVNDDDDIDLGDDDIPDDDEATFLADDDDDNDDVSDLIDSDIDNDDEH